MLEQLIIRIVLLVVIQFRTHASDVVSFGERLRRVVSNRGVVTSGQKGLMVVVSW